jgi:chemotaxis regulatin CheY-phosphate phosphatase CheZ
MSVMDIMQYQDIHRQKIERVINVMRALSKYMNTLFEGKIDDDKRVSSAQHIAGDTHNDVASTDDIEALLAQFGS